MHSCTARNRDQVSRVPSWGTLFIPILSLVGDGMTEFHPSGGSLSSSSSTFSFGKYRNKSIEEVILKDPGYIRWLQTEGIQKLRQSNKPNLVLQAERALKIIQFWINILDSLPFNRRYRTCFVCGDRPDIVVVGVKGTGDYYGYFCDSHRTFYSAQYEKVSFLTTYEDATQTRFPASALKALLLAKGHDVRDLLNYGLDFLLSEEAREELRSLIVNLSHFQSYPQSYPSPKADEFTEFYLQSFLDAPPEPPAWYGGSNSGDTASDV